RGINYQEAAKLVDSTKTYEITDAVEILKKASKANFDESVEVDFRLGDDPIKAEENLREALVLPHGTSKTQRVLVFAKGDIVKQKEDVGSYYIGDADIIAKINDGWFEFDVIVATPDMMGEVGKLGRVLGPKGLMPNPKTGTVTFEVEKAVNE